MFEGLLKTKLFPPHLRANQVERLPLLEKFNQARQQRDACILVSAPAGFGKTTLVANCANASGLPFAWLALDENDNDLLRFWRYMDAALATIDNSIGKELRPALYASQTPVIEQIITGLVNDIATLNKEFILVLDDYHSIKLPAIQDSLNFLLDHRPPQMFLVIITRSDPPLNLARRRGRGQLMEIRAADLRFSALETNAFLNQTMRLGLSEADILLLSQRTEGWVAGLQMAALSMQTEADPHHFVTAFSGDDHHIADYLVEEVLQRQLVEIQHFLLQTSILDRLTAPLCDAVTGRQDSRAMLNTLELANLFILPLDNHREWFRYHHLFAELLRQRLRETYSAEEIVHFHRTALTWYETRGDIASAIHHANAISDERAVLGLLERNAGRFFASGELPQFFESANLLSPELRRDSPFVCITAAWAGLASNRYAEISLWLESIEAHFGLPAEAALQDPSLTIAQRAALLEVLIIRLQLPATRPPAEQLNHILAIRAQLNTMPSSQVCLLNSVESLKPVLAFNIGTHAEATGDLSLASQALSETIPLSRQEKNANLFHLAAAHLANIQVIQGRLSAARQTCEQALAENPNFGLPVSPFTAVTCAVLGQIYYEWNQLEIANQYFHAGLQHARLWNLWEGIIPMTLGEAWIKRRTGDMKAALDILARLEKPPLPGMELALQSIAALWKGSEAASGWLAAHRAELDLEVNPTNEFVLLTIARLLVSAHRFEEAYNVLSRIMIYAQERGRVHILIQAKVALSAARGLPDMLVEALRLGESEGYLSTFLVEGEAMQKLLEAVAKHKELEARFQAYIQKILAGFSSSPASPAGENDLQEQLSERELEVLRLIAKGLSNPEIARQLYLSPNTLKAHTQNIFLKLEVHSRLQAANRAKELGLIA